MIGLFEKKQKQPDRPFLILLLSKVPGPSAPLFQKGYRPPKEQSELKLKDVKHFDNSDNFWTGLSQVSSKLKTSLNFSKLKPYEFLLLARSLSAEETQQLPDRQGGQAAC